MSKPWSGAGAWAADAERADAEAVEAAYAPAEAFPTLGEAISSAKPQKKKKNQAVSLSELVTGKYVGPGGGKTRVMSDTQKLTANEMLMLPTGPRDRSDEEPQYGGLGGGFKDYGGYRGDRDRDRGDRDRDSDRGYGGRSRDRGFGGGFERERATSEFGRDKELDDGPSRADETDDWGATKKFVPSQAAYGGGYDDDRRGGKVSDRDLPSRADEVENWGSTKKYTPSNGLDKRGSGYGFDDSRRGYEEAPSRRSGGGYQEAAGYRRSGGFEDAPGRGLNSRADESGDWGSSRKFLPSASRGGDSGFDSDRWSRREQTTNGFSHVSERPRLVLHPRSRSIDDEGLSQKVETLTETVDQTQQKAKPNPFGAARPREEVLAEKGQDWRKIDSDLSSRGKDSRPSSRPSSSHSSRPATPDSFIDIPIKPRPKINPFGDAKPREILLQERGKDWRKIEFELEHRSVDRPFSEEEKLLKEEIDYLVHQLTGENEDQLENKNSKLGPEGELDVPEEKQRIKQQIQEKEKQLEQLTRALDDKIRFSQRAGDRPLSRSGRSEAGTGRVYELPRGDGRVADVWTRASDIDQDRRGRDRFEDIQRRR